MSKGEGEGWEEYFSFFASRGGTARLLTIACCGLKDLVHSTPCPMMIRRICCRGGDSGGRV